MIHERVVFQKRGGGETTIIIHTGREQVRKWGESCRFWYSWCFEEEVDLKKWTDVSDSSGELKRTEKTITWGEGTGKKTI